MHYEPPPVFTRYPRVVPSVLVLFCALQHISSGIRRRTGFISRIVSHWYAILWEGEMFHDFSEVDLGFVHFRRDLLEGFHGDAACY